MASESASGIVAAWEAHEEERRAPLEPIAGFFRPFPPR
jgi:hypothetical protein